MKRAGLFDVEDRRRKLLATRDFLDRVTRWTKKNGMSFYGYKNHANVDRTHKFIRRYSNLKY